MPEEVVVPTTEPFPEYDDLKKAHVEEVETRYIDEAPTMEKKRASFGRICASIFLSWLIVSLIIGTLAIVYQPAQGPLVVIVCNYCWQSAQKFSNFFQLIWIAGRIQC